MKLIVGLGNPGRKYEQTRHNVGFMVAEKLATLIGAGPIKERFNGEVAEGIVRPKSDEQAGSSEKLVILCPHTYMNASGKSVRKACDFFKITPEDVLVVCDDLNLPTGRIRLRPSGSAGGQKGLADIIRLLGTDEVPRLRIGIDRPPPQWDVSDYVLGKLAGEEKDKVDAAADKSVTASIDWATQGIGFAMNLHNVNPNPKKKPNKKKQPKPDTKPKPSADGEAGESTTK
jgi:PTH1 family peptidyl-tRNA hydrolase